ncbi:Digalactosyldiacylglycerol synthase 2-chloroplastic [Striga hermonthica]|uniref:Digalactosyldiacylglycerol synthase 2-chloroplastic n=1 Tax=Striga hermonthica TaxID=68872 RepID=A0A9N7R9U4_STRHE|nr:Digalactosyldiacylglycerol synthase 2-chloroplastic [Striga hermonthica]
MAIRQNKGFSASNIFRQEISGFPAEYNKLVIGVKTHESMDKKQHIAIFTTASLPWLTGTSVNPLFRAAYLAKDDERKVTLVIPWLKLKDQEHVYPNNITFSSPAEQEKYVRRWLEERTDLRSSFAIRFYPGRFSLHKRSILALGDITEVIPDEEADIAVLEEPEHLTWYHHGKRWKIKFRLVDSPCRSPSSNSIRLRDYRQFLQIGVGPPTSLATVPDVVPPTSPRLSDMIVNVGVNLGTLSSDLGGTDSDVIKYHRPRFAGNSTSVIKSFTDRHRRAAQNDLKPNQSRHQQIQARPQFLQNRHLDPRRRRPASSHLTSNLGYISDCGCQIFHLHKSRSTTCR